MRYLILLFLATPALAECPAPPDHGTAMDIAGQGIANPLAMVLSVAMMYRYSLDQGGAADLIEGAVGRVLGKGLRTADIFSGADGEEQIGTQAMAEAVLEEFANG